MHMAEELAEIISIHAPTRGATIANAAGRRRGTNFNPRSYKRSDWRQPADAGRPD